MKPYPYDAKSPVPWNRNRLVGQKAPLKLKEIWAIRIRLQLADKTRDLALFNLAIDSKLGGCDLVSLRVCDIAHGKAVLPRTMVMQRKTHRPVQFEITEQTRQSASAWIEKAHLASNQYLFPSRVAKSPHLSAPIRMDRGVLGRIDWAGFSSLRHAYDATNEGDVDLPADKKLTRRPTSFGAYQARKHRKVSGH